MPVAPRVSVVVPCYNAERYLAAALDSALAQDGRSARGAGRRRRLQRRHAGGAGTLRRSRPRPAPGPPRAVGRAQRLPARRARRVRRAARRRRSLPARQAGAAGGGARRAAGRRTGLHRLARDRRRRHAAAAPGLVARGGRRPPAPAARQPHASRRRDAASRARRRCRRLRRVAAGERGLGPLPAARARAACAGRASTRRSASTGCTAARATAACRLVYETRLRILERVFADPALPAGLCARRGATPSTRRIWWARRSCSPRARRPEAEPPSCAAVRARPESLGDAATMRRFARLLQPTGRAAPGGSPRGAGRDVTRTLWGAVEATLADAGARARDRTPALGGSRARCCGPVRACSASVSARERVACRETAAATVRGLADQRTRDRARRRHLEPARAVGPRRPTARAGTPDGPRARGVRSPPRSRRSRCRRGRRS